VLFRSRSRLIDSTVAELINRLREKNYISYTPSALALYEQALLGEYRRFFEKKKR
jgi:hypothetical protein